MRRKAGSSPPVPLLFGAALLAVVLGACDAVAKAVAPNNGGLEPPVRRTAARALERSFSTQWLPDVESRLQLLLGEIADQPVSPEQSRQSGPTEEIRW